MTRSGTSTPLFHRTGNSGLFGKRTQAVKGLVAAVTKDELQRLCADAGLTESEFVAIVVEAAVHGREHVLKVQQARIERVLGMGQK